MTTDAESAAALERFVVSLRINYDQWREGVGYDLAALRELNSEERSRVLALLQTRLERPGAGWREVEAVAALETDEARATLAELAKHENIEVRLRACTLMGGRHKDRRIETEVIHILRNPDADVSMKTDQVLMLAAANPTDAMQRALLFGAVDGARDLRVHAAALAFHLAGRTDEAFDWNFRPLFLEFGEDDRAVRLAALRKLKALIRGDER